MIETWGRGFEKIREACRTAGNPDSILRYDLGGLWIEFISVKMTEKPPLITSQDIDLQIAEVLRKRPEITIAELAVEIGLSDRAVKYGLATLKKAGKIQRIGPDNGGHWEVKGKAE